jgi:hypothetical protein
MSLKSEVLGKVPTDTIVGMNSSFSTQEYQVIGNEPARRVNWRVTGDGIKARGLPEGTMFEVKGLVGMNQMFENFEAAVIRRNVEDGKYHVRVDKNDETTNESGKYWPLFVEFGTGNYTPDRGVGFMGRAAKKAMREDFPELIDKALGQGSRTNMNDVMFTLAVRTAKYAKANATEASLRIKENITVGEGVIDNAIANSGGESQTGIPQV